MRTDYTTEAPLGENKDRCLINIEIDAGDVSDVEVIDAESGKNVTGLIYGGPSWHQAWSIAERRIMVLPEVQRQIQRTFREQTFDTPFAYGVAA